MSCKPPVFKVIACAVLGAAVSPLSQAALGGDMTSVRRDHEALRATDTITSMPSYDVHEGAAPNGQRLREYVDRAGTVFAVSWQGPQTPDVGGLLGGFAARYQEAVRNHRGSHHVLVINDPDLAVTVVRLPRGWQMLSIVPTAMPTGVSRADIR